MSSVPVPIPCKKRELWRENGGTYAIYETRMREFGGTEIMRSIVANGLPYAQAKAEIDAWYTDPKAV